MKSHPRYLLLTLFCYVLLFSATKALALDQVYTSFWSDKALGGYDAVAYFTEGKPVEGAKEDKKGNKTWYEYNGATWLFSSVDNLNKFKKNPEKYAPQYGGYCAWAIAHNETAKGDPHNWKIVNGKLYLNYDQKVQNKWLANMNEFIERADKYWPEILNKK